MSGSHTAERSALLPNYNASKSATDLNAGGSGHAMSNAQQFDTPRKSQTYARQPDELHLTSPAGGPTQRGQLSPREYAAAGPPRISLELASPESSQFQAGSLPGSLQAGGPNRSGPPSTNTIPQTMAQDQYANPSRPAPLNASHSYSRSSPSAGFDGQNYMPYPSTPGSSELSQYASPATQKYTPQQRNVSNTPLGLADIRPRADPNLLENVPGANPYSYDGANAVPTNSNYLAPWAIYAFDWCKWPAQSHDAGKVAVGSYLEDGHNFVRRFRLLFR